MNIILRPSAKLVWILANIEAINSNSKKIELVHIFLAVLLILDDCYSYNLDLIKLFGLDLQEINDSIECARREINIPAEKITEVRRLIIKSLHKKIASGYKGFLHRSQETSIFFDNVIDIAVSEGKDYLDLVHFVKALKRLFGNENGNIEEDFSNFAQYLIDRFEMDGSSYEEIKELEADSSIISEIGYDLVLMARKGLLPPVVGRKKEILSLARYLQRTFKRNVLILGRAGVGKTAIVEGLAQKIAEGSVPKRLLSLRIFRINISDLVAGTKYRGEMEEKLKRLIEEASSNPDIVIFFDEFHMVVKAGVTEGQSLDIAGILKPALARSDFRCIGATTTEEFDRYIKNDKALMRRFQIIKLSEVSNDVAIEICKKWAQHIEKQQHVHITQEAIIAAVELSDRFVTDKALPDKAIDILENATVMVLISSLSSETIGASGNLLHITRDHIIEAIEDQYKISIRKQEYFSMRDIEEKLISNVFGQGKAIRTLCKEIEICLRNSDRHGKPIGVFMFVGPTGTGKTYSAEILGGALFPYNKNATIRFNMNEYNDRSSINKLIGAPPGFIGHERLGALFEYVEDNSQGLIILDEMEKACDEVKNYFLQIFDKGEAQDSRGRKAYFSNFIFIMTCNADLNDHKHVVGFNRDAKDWYDKEFELKKYTLSQYFSAEFIGRIQKVIHFDHLDSDAFEILLGKYIEEFSLETEKMYSIKFAISNNAKEQFVKFCLNQPDGCRGFIGLFKRLIELQAINYIERKEVKGDLLLIRFDDETAVFYS